MLKHTTMPTYIAHTRTIGYRPRSKRLREMGGTVNINKGAEAVEADLSGCELITNKVTEVTPDSTDDQYPTAKCLYDINTALGLLISALQTDKANLAYVQQQDTNLQSAIDTLGAAVANFQSAINAKADANHTHQIADVSGLQAALNNLQNQQQLVGTDDFNPDVYEETEWGEQQLKPEYNPLPDYLTYLGALSLYNQVVNKGDVMWNFEYPLNSVMGSGVRLLWDALTTKSYIDRMTAAVSSAAAPTAHTHTIADVANLASQLAAKADVSHTHTIADLTDKAALFTQFALNNGVLNLTIGGQQRSITMPTANTPSGDPMHYFYTELGCTYNTTTGLWTYRDLTDLTTEQVRASYVYTACVRNNLDRRAWGRANVLPSTVRFTFNADGQMQENMPYSFARFMQTNAQIEYLYIQDSNGIYDYCNPNNIGYDGTIMCLRCTKLKKVATIFAAYGFVSASLTLTDARTSFNFCPQLTYLRLYNLGRDYAKSTYANAHKCRNYFWEGTPLDYDSLKFMVVNAANAIGINIWLSDTSYSYIENDTTAYTYNGASYTGLKALAAAKLIDLRKFSTDYDTTTPANSYASYLT